MRSIIGEHTHLKKTYLDNHEMPFKELRARIDYRDTIYLEDWLVSRYFY